MVRRLPDWPRRLEAFLAANAATPFRYGSFDCCLMAAVAIQAMTGKHPHPEYIGAYSTRSECRALIRRETGKSGVEFIWQQVMQENGIQECPVKCAQRGDAVLIKRGKSGSSVAIVGLDGRLVVAGDVGLLLVDRGLAVRAWRV